MNNIIVNNICREVFRAAFAWLVEVELLWLAIVFPGVLILCFFAFFFFFFFFLFFFFFIFFFFTLI